MAILFSVVELSAGDDRTSFMMGGFPKTKQGMQGWIQYEEFIMEQNGMQITANVKGYLYGEDTVYPATPEEIAYFMQRLDMNPEFLERSCQSAEESSFEFTTEQTETFGMEMS